jgi:hypothetical protein
VDEPTKNSWRRGESTLRLCKFETHFESFAKGDLRVELDGQYERLPRRKFITRNLDAIEGRKQLNFVFEYRKEGSACLYSFTL